MPTPDLLVRTVRAPRREVDRVDPPALSRRDHAILRAVARGPATVVAGDLVLDGRCCSDQFAARRLIHTGLVEGAAYGSRAPARLTAAGRRALVGPDRAR